MVNSQKHVHLVQIGACDGVSHDPIHQILEHPSIAATLVEPVPTNFSELERTYRGYSNVTLVNAAITNRAGQQRIYTVADTERLSRNWTKGWASLQREHLLRLGVRENEIEEKIVTTMELSQLLNHDKADILIVDTEGHDDVIVNAALDLPEPPAVIYFEHVHLSSKRISSCCAALTQADYAFSFGTMDVLCTHRRLMNNLLGNMGPEVSSC